MWQFFNIFIALASLGGIAFVVCRKIPLLLELSANEEGAGLSVPGRARQVIRGETLRTVAQEKVLNGTLVRARKLAAKAEMQTGEWLEKLHGKSERRKREFDESYWEQLRKKPKE